MEHLEALKEARKINSTKNRIVAKVVKSNYKGMEVVTEPIELTIIKSSLETMRSSGSSFLKNYRRKYGR